MPLNFGVVVKESKSMPPKAEGGRFRSKIAGDMASMLGISKKMCVLYQIVTGCVRKRCVLRTMDEVSDFGPAWSSLVIWWLDEG